MVYKDNKGPEIPPFSVRRLYGTNDVASILGVSTYDVTSLITKGLYPEVQKIGKTRIFTDWDVYRLEQRFANGKPSEMAGVVEELSTAYKTTAIALNELKTLENALNSQPLKDIIAKVNTVVGLIASVYEQLVDEEENEEEEEEDEPEEEEDEEEEEETA